MNLEGLDCWDDYPMEHGCICGNDCAPPVHLDPEPWVSEAGNRYPVDQHRAFGVATFSPRPGYSQNKEDYA